ncbi:hypothetical protein Tco_0360899 [Tanacetum coccineum]
MKYGMKKLLICYSKETIVYYFYNLYENKIFVACYAEFFENSLTLQEANGSHGLLEASGSDVGLELIQEETHNLRMILANNTMRISQAPDKYGFYVDAEEYKLRDLDEPPNYKAVLLDPESDKWLDAMNAETQSMKDNQVWCLVDFLPNGRTFGSK